MTENAVNTEAISTAKKDWQSSTVWGAIIMGLSLVVEMVWGVEIDPDARTAAANHIVSIISAIMGLIGGATTVIGRARANGPAELSLFRILKFIPGVLGAVNKAKNAATGSGGAVVVLLVSAAILGLASSPAMASDGTTVSGLDLLAQSAWPALINLGYCLVAAVVGIILFKVLDLSLILPDHRTMALIAQGNVAAGAFAGLVIAGLFVMIGLVLG